jgi:hypothetical protein
MTLLQTFLWCVVFGVLGCIAALVLHALIKGEPKDDDEREMNLIERYRNEGRM